MFNAFRSSLLQLLPVKDETRESSIAAVIVAATVVPFTSVVAILVPILSTILGYVAVIQSEHADGEREFYASYAGTTALVWVVKSSSAFLR